MDRHKTAMFIGHSECFQIEKETLYPIIRELIGQGVDTFLSGGYGEFDYMSAHAVYEMKKEFPHIENLVVIPYFEFKVYEPQYIDGTLFPDGLEFVPYKAKIVQRNRYMVQNSAYAICYVNYHFGGAGKTYEYAKKQGLKIFNLGNMKSFSIPPHN